MIRADAVRLPTPMNANNKGAHSPVIAKRRLYRDTGSKGSTWSHQIRLVIGFRVTVKFMVTIRVRAWSVTARHSEGPT